MRFTHKSNEVKYFTLKERVEKIEKEQDNPYYGREQKYADDSRKQIYLDLMKEIINQDKLWEMFSRKFPPLNIIEVWKNHEQWLIL